MVKPRHQIFREPLNLRAFAEFIFVHCDAGSIKIKIVNLRLNLHYLSIFSLRKLHKSREFGIANTIFVNRICNSKMIRREMEKRALSSPPIPSNSNVNQPGNLLNTRRNSVAGFPRTKSQRTLPRRTLFNNAPGERQLIAKPSLLLSQDVPPSFHRPQSRLGYEERPQSRVGYTSDSRCASGLGYDDTGGGYLDQSDPRMYCTSGYCMGDTMMAASRGVCGEEVELDMRRHIQACACTCNHMGYGNYMDYQVNSLTFNHVPRTSTIYRPKLQHFRSFSLLHCI